MSCHSCAHASHPHICTRNPPHAPQTSRMCWPPPQLLSSPLAAAAALPLPAARGLCCCAETPCAAWPPHALALPPAHRPLQAPKTAQVKKLDSCATAHKDQCTSSLVCDSCASLWLYRCVHVFCVFLGNCMCAMLVHGALVACSFVHAFFVCVLHIAFVCLSESGVLSRHVRTHAFDCLCVNVCMCKFWLV